MFKSDTDGEKEYEEFFTDNEVVDEKKFQQIAIIKNEPVQSTVIEYADFKEIVGSSKYVSRLELVLLIEKLVPELSHNVTGKTLNERM